MDELTIIGAPFSLNHGSSCSTRKPKNFRWSGNPDSPIYILADRAIPMSLHSSVEDKILYGWIVESFQVVPDVILFIKNNKEKLFEKIKGIFTCSDELTQEDSRFIKIAPGSNLPWGDRDECQIYKKSKNVSMLSSSKNFTKGHRIRWGIASNLKDKIDLYGGVANSKVIGVDRGTHHRPKLEALQEYRFSITIENDNHPGYYTEKITDCFVTGTIPLYWGDPNISKIFDPNGIITINDPTKIDWILDLEEKDYMDRTDAIKKNFEIAMNLKMADEMIYEYIK
jgi:hypothetical protein